MATSLVSTLSSIAAAIPTSISKQGFANVMSINNDINNMTGSQLLTFIIVFTLCVWLLMFLGAWIFNTSIPNIIPSVRKVSVVDFFGLYIICHILFT
jgi:hypothetical protein